MSQAKPSRFEFENITRAFPHLQVLYTGFDLDISLPRLVQPMLHLHDLRVTLRVDMPMLRGRRTPAWPGRKS